MVLCAYCGRQLPLLHRIIGASRFCSKRHADLYQKELDELSVQALSRLRPAFEAPAGAPPPLLAATRRNSAETSRTTEEQVPAAAQIQAAISGQPMAFPLLSPPAPDECAAPAAPCAFLPLPCVPSLAQSDTASAVHPLHPRRRLFAPAFHPDPFSRLAPSPRPALNPQPLALTPLSGAVLQPVSPLVQAPPPVAAPALPRFCSTFAGPALRAPLTHFLPLSCCALSAPAALLSAPVSTLVSGLICLPLRSFRVLFSAPIPPLSTYEGPALPVPASPVRAWEPLLSLSPLTRRAARVPLARPQSTVPAPSLGPISVAPRPVSRRALPLRRFAHLQPPLFIPKAVLLPVRPACSFGPMPSSRPAAPPRPTGSVVPIRPANSAENLLRSAVARLPSVLP